MRILVLLLLCLPCWLLAQSNFPKGVYWEGGLHIGKIFKHTSSIKIDIPPMSVGGELSLEYKMYGKKAWQAYAGFPRLGVALSYQNFDDPKRLGFGVGIMPHITVDFLRVKGWRIFGRLGLGMGVVSRPYNIANNPDNNIIGSYINNNTQLRLGVAIPVHREWELRPSMSFTHYSNGATQFPNLGINVISFHLGVCHKINPVEKEDIIRPDSMPHKTLHWRPQVCVLTAVGMRESSTMGGPKYPMLMTSADIGFRVARNNRLKVGFEYEWNGATYAFQSQLGIYGADEARWRASRMSVFIEDEVLLGRLGLIARLGFYVLDKEKHPRPTLYFTQVALRYYLFNPLVTPRRVNPFIGIALKAHVITAEYFSLQMGMTF